MILEDIMPYLRGQYEGFLKELVSEIKAQVYGELKDFGMVFMLSPREFVIALENEKDIKESIKKKIETMRIRAKGIFLKRLSFYYTIWKSDKKEIENKLIALMKSGCFDIDIVEVDVFNGIAHIFIDGEDAALLIGKEGYRYNAMSYMLFNWINAHYGLYIKLEIAEFIQTQEEMIVNYLKPIIEHIREKGRGKTKPLDGILVQIALELLRAEFPNKYVAIKTARDGRKFIIINDFNSSKKK
jgi:hypothetical protein